MYRYTKVHYTKRRDFYDVTVYYSKAGAKLRSSTGVRVLHKHLTAKGTISSAHPYFEEDLRKIKIHQDQIEDLVASYYDQYGERPPVQWLEKRLDKPQEDARKNLKEALCHWPDFVAEKRQVLRNEDTVKRYNNFAETLEKYEKKRGIRIAFSQLDQEFFNDFLSYMVSEHEYVHNMHMKNLDTLYKPSVGISNETAIKRMKDFVEYLKFCIVEQDMTSINLEKIKKHIRMARHKHEVRPLSKTQRWGLTLTTEELEYFVNLDHYEPDFQASLTDNQKKYLDIFVFMCLQGTAPIDTKNIAKTDIRNGRIIKERSKSGNEFRVDLHPVSEQILARHSYNLDFVEQTLNSELKKIFVTAFELYRRFYEKNNDEPYDNICIQKAKKGNREVLKIQHRGLFVEAMTGRRSFLTNLGEKADEVGIKQIMDKAGHTVIGTTLGYIHTRQQNKKAGGDLFGIKKL